LGLIFRAFPTILISIIEKKYNARSSRHPEVSLPERVLMDR
jgi:hypothetical protein